MDILTTLPTPFALQPGELPCPAHEAANGAMEAATDAVDAAEGPLAQLGAAPDVTPEAIGLGIQLRQLLQQAAQTADALAAATLSH
jgi:hypothetical protein